MITKTTLGAVIMFTLVTTIVATSILLQQRSQAITEDHESSGTAIAPPAITGDHVYVAWWINKTGNDEVFFRASDSRGQNFGDKINLSNTTEADSTRVEIDSDAQSVVVTWWETNQTDDIPVMRVSNDYGKTFGPLLKLATNGTIGS